VLAASLCQQQQRSKGSIFGYDGLRQMGIRKLPPRRATVRLVVVVIVILVWLFVRSGWWDSWFPAESPSSTSVDQLFENRQSNVWVEVDGYRQGRRNISENEP
jgi:hypothetical protein